MGTRYGGVPQRDSADVIRERGYDGPYLGPTADEISGGDEKPFQRVRSTPAGYVDSKGSVRGTEPTITALWAAVNVLQQDVAELQREIFQEGEE